MRTVYSLSFCRARSAVRRPRSGDNSRASLCLWQDAVAAVEAAAAAWDKGQGAWPRMSAAARIAAVEAVLADLQERRAEIVDVLMWEICKSAGDAVRSRVGYDVVCPPPTPAPGCWRQGERTADGQPRLGTIGAFHGCARPPVGGRQTGSRGVLLYDTPPPPDRRWSETVSRTNMCARGGRQAKEFDRTMDYARASIAAYRAQDESEPNGMGAWTTVSGVTARVRRGPVGPPCFAYAARTATAVTDSFVRVCSSAARSALSYRTARARACAVPPRDRPLVRTRRCRVAARARVWGSAARDGLATS